MIDKPSKRIEFHYIKSNHFRTVHADGAWGGLTPRGYIHASFYSERAAIPRTLIHEVNDDGTLGDEIRDERITREGIVREVEVDVIFDIPTAKVFHAWLGERLANFEAKKPTTST